MKYTHAASLGNDLTLFFYHFQALALMTLELVTTTTIMLQGLPPKKLIFWRLLAFLATLATSVYDTMVWFCVQVHILRPLRPFSPPPYRKLKWRPPEVATEAMEAKIFQGKGSLKSISNRIIFYGLLYQGQN